MSSYSVETLTKAYVQLRDAKSELKKTYEEEAAKLEIKMEKIEVQLMTKLREFQIDSMKTPFGTVFTQTETKYSTADWMATWNWAKEYDRLDIMEKRLSQGACKTLVEEGIELPPGVEVRSEKVIRIRRS